MNPRLVIGIGNTLRGDDGAGIRAALRLEGLLPGVEVLAVHALTPELADVIAHRDCVVFLDASFSSGTVTVGPVPPDDASAAVASHTLTPSRLLALASSLFGAAPRTALLAQIPARDVRLGETLSPATAAAVEECVQRVSALLTDEAAGG